MRKLISYLIPLAIASALTLGVLKYADEQTINTLARIGVGFFVIIVIIVLMYKSLK